MLADLAEEARAGAAAYGSHLKPLVKETLESLGLDVVYERAEGDSLFFREGGDLVRVLDLVGGYGASLFGHNHPELVLRARQVLDQKRPFHAQGSVRALAGRLSQRLAERTGRATGRGDVVTLASTGAAAVEAAMKHAELEMRRRIDRVLAATHRARKLYRARVNDGAPGCPRALLDEAAAKLGVPSLEGEDELFARVLETNAARFATRPAFLALERGFHGKSTGALSLTANPHYRHLWQRVVLPTTFLAVSEATTVADVVLRSSFSYFEIELGREGALVLHERPWANVAAAFAEPVQGEGGVRTVPHALLASLRDAADRGGFPLVFDEIQAGMGRTGAFLASEASGVRGDYYLFSKSLGGGLAKISALLVDEERYDRDFGLLHTSTFAEDDASCAVALGALDLLEENDGALLRACRARGLALVERLRACQEKYPGFLADVRGQGLMIGVELAEPPRTSALLRVAWEQELYGYLVAAYMLHTERIRVMPTLSAPQTLRVQPSAYVRDDELARFVDALARLADRTRRGDTAPLLHTLAGASATRRAASAPARASAANEAAPRNGSAYTVSAGVRSDPPRVIGFLGHFLEATDVRHWDPALAALSDSECRVVADRVKRLVDPFVADRVIVRSARGDAVKVVIVGVPFTSEHVVASMESGDLAWARARIDDAVALAKAEGATLVGFGGYTSIVTDNCRSVVEDGVGLTTGNALTAAAAVDATLAAARRRGITELRVGVVGALGNIGSVMADALAPLASAMVLVGRPGAQRRLELRAKELRAHRLRSQVEVSLESSLLHALIGGAVLDAVARGEEPTDAAVRVSTTMTDLRSCNVILAATNAPRPVLDETHLGAGPVVVCDVAAPGDVSPSAVQARKDVTFLAGGIVRLPLGQRVAIPGVSLAPGHIYGCLAETVVLGLSARTRSFSLGKLTLAHVDEARRLAMEHGFSFGEQALTF